jgi:AMP-polyphosphate phosphotransferase
MAAGEGCKKMHENASREQTRSEIDAGNLELGRLQRAAQAAKIPIVIVVEGWQAAGKGTLINGLTLALDSRGFRVVSVHPAPKQEPSYPPLHRFWVTLPEEGRITIYDRSWYRDLWSSRAHKQIKREELDKELSGLLAFEKTLIDSGILVIKFFLQVEHAQQTKRLQRLRENDFTRWRVDDEALHQNRHFEQWQKAAEEVLFTRTRQTPCPLVNCRSDDRRATQLRALKALNNAIRQRLEALNSPDMTPVDSRDSSQPVSLPVSPSSAPESAAATPLSRVDLTQKLSRENYEQQLPELQARLRELEHRIYTKRIGVVIGCEGWDAAGKGGQIRRLVSGLDPRGYDVHPISAPNSVERAHHYLWRFWTRIPKAGHIAIFDRTWYGRVLVERVEGFCTEEQWQRAYGEIAEFEQSLIRAGIVLVKFWFQIDTDTQLARFHDRQSQPDKQWKITEEDWRNRQRWSEYEKAVNDMLTFNDSKDCPYWIVPANDKLFARIFTLKRVIEAIEQGLNRRK